jgi:hypothetical protein
MVTDTRTAIRAHHLQPLNLPRPIEVVATGYPVAIFWRDQSHRVLGIQEQWQIDEEWWRDRPISRRYYRLLVESGLLTIFQDLLDGGWFVQHAGAPRPLSQPVALAAPPRPTTSLPLSRNGDGRAVA